MKSLALSTSPPGSFRLLRAPRARAEHWLALVVVLIGMTLPECCLTGHHLVGVGMEGFGPICHAGL